MGSLLQATRHFSSDLIADSHLQPNASTLQERSCNQTLKTFSELKIRLPASPPPPVPLISSSCSTPCLAPLPSPSRGGLRGLLADGATCACCGRGPRGGGGEQNTNVTLSSGGPSQSWKMGSVDQIQDLRALRSREGQTLWSQQC